ncbi:hypothetical protein AB1Y20_001615 [Prymnesium parvum]|uniref:JmjC domain-containing protein n=1 Tax=Prymnesium parvum TaxID=97485 RepID=A0AB34KD17_PRYPA
MASRIPDRDYRRFSRMVPREHSPSPARVRALMERGTPFVASGLLTTWPAAEWQLRTLMQRFGDAPTCVRLHPKAEGEVYEGECAYVKATLGEFCLWLEGADEPSASADSPFAPFPRSDYVAYADYQDMPALFRHLPSALSCVDWTTVLGGAARDGAESVLWLGSHGASTPTHYDAYGCNVVAQCAGEKRWRLCAPAAPAAPRPSRVPYEESSVFAAGGAAALGSGGACELLLAAGEVLFVPRHWWHDVSTRSAWALSINTWLDAEGDDVERAREAVVRLVVSALLRRAREGEAPPYLHEPRCGFVNPTEELHSAEEDLAMLSAAIGKLEAADGCMECDAAEERGGGASEGGGADASAPSSGGGGALPPLGAMDVARAVCLGAAIEAAAAALSRDALGDGAALGDGGGERLRAPLGRLLRGVLAQPSSERQAHGEQFGQAFERLREAPGGSEIDLTRVINAVCTGDAVQASLSSLRDTYRARLQAAGVRRKRDRDDVCTGTTAKCTMTPGTCDCNESCVVA